MSPENIFDPDPGAPGGVMTPDFFYRDPSGVMTLEMFFGPKPGSRSLQGHSGVDPV